jgi:eukaryotic-like serine/threonine-protein kinase
MGMSDHQLEPGSCIAGRYRVQRELSRGDMTAVVAAIDEQTGRAVAVKLMFSDALANTEKAARLKREAVTATSIANEHVVEVLDVGAQSEGAPYIVMELLDGETLGSRLKREGSLPWEQAVDVLLQVCAGLARAHANRVFHRDLNTDNIFLVTRPQGGVHVKIINFGMSKADAIGSPSLTSTGAILGHPETMAPEQACNAKDVDARTDIWALGALLQEMITGKPPFHADSLPRLVDAILHNPAAPLRAGRPEVPVALQDATQRCLEKLRVNRFANVAELAAQIAQSGAPGAEAAASQIAARLHAARGAAPKSQPPPSQNMGVILAIAAALLCVTGLAVWLLLRAR